MARFPSIKQYYAKYGLHAIRPVYLPRVKRPFFNARYIMLLGFSQQSWNFYKKTHKNAAKNRLDKWSKHTINSANKRYKGRVLHPFTSNPFYPFQQWALQAGFEVSPLKILIHPSFGLWLGFRGAIAYKHIKMPAFKRHGVSKLCGTCVDKPCLTSCPVNSINLQDWDYITCKNYLYNASQSSCVRHACQARLRCPYGKRYRYKPVMGRFFTRQLLHKNNGLTKG